jgi:UrcA family protein
MPRQLRFVILCSRRSCGNSSTGKVTDMKTKTGATIYAAALLLTIGAAAAQAADDVSSRDGQVTIRSVPVRYTVESLNHDDGKQALVARLESAARRACGSFDIKDLDARRRWNECYEAALADAVARVGTERVAASN